MNKLIESIKKYVYYITNIITIILVVFAACYIFQTAILKKQYANMFGFTLFRVSTGSMADEINVGDVIVVKLTDTVEIGQIIVFEQDGGLIVHRLIDKTADKLITKGDANNFNDEPISIAQVKGKVEKVLPGKAIVLVAILLIAINIIAYVILNIFEKRHAIENKETKDYENK